MTLRAISPATGTMVDVYEETSTERVAAIVERAHEAFLAWRRTKFAERAVPIRRSAENLRALERDYATLMALEMGKPIRGGIDEVRACAWLCDYYAEYAEDILQREYIPKFLVKNTGSVRHEFSIGDTPYQRAHATMMKKMPNMVHSDPNMVTLEPGQTKTVIWKFNRPVQGQVIFACHEPGHYEAGMKTEVTLGK